MIRPDSITAELLPQGEFILTLNMKTSNPKIKGRFSLYALDRFCAAKDNITYLQAIGKITLGMKISEYAELLVYALQEPFRANPDEAGVTIDGQKIYWCTETVLDYILDPMGLGSEISLSLFKHAVGRLGSIIETKDESPDKKKPKKSQTSR